MIKLAGKGDNLEENKNKMLEKIKSQEAYNKFKEMVQNQCGDISYLEDVNKFEKAKYIINVKSEKNGIVKEVDAMEVGKLACFLGAGRMKKEDTIDKSVGIVLNKKVGNTVKQGETLATLHINDEKKRIEAEKKLKEIYIIDEI